MTTRTVHAFAIPSHLPPGALRHGVAVVVDQLRASTTICAALHAGARAVRPCLEPQEALALLAADPGVVLGGERSGVPIPGFDLGNSPWEYTPERVGGRTVGFTTTNGTRAILHAREHGAARVVVGCLANLSVLTRALAAEPRPVHLLGAGTGGEVSMEDCLAAGAIARGLFDAGREPSRDDAALMFATLYAALAAPAGPAGALLGAMRGSRGGRNLQRIDLGGDIALCAEIDRYPVVPEFDAAAGEFRAHRSMAC